MQFVIKSFRSSSFQIGSFFMFPLSKQIEGPLLLLNKYLRYNFRVTDYKTIIKKMSDIDLKFETLHALHALICITYRI